MFQRIIGKNQLPTPTQANAPVCDSGIELTAVKAHTRTSRKGKKHAVHSFHRKGELQPGQRVQIGKTTLHRMKNGMYRMTMPSRMPGKSISTTVNRERALALIGKAPSRRRPVIKPKGKPFLSQGVGLPSNFDEQFKIQKMVEESRKAERREMRQANMKLSKYARARARKGMSRKRAMKLGLLIRKT